MPCIGLSYDQILVVTQASRIASSLCSLLTCRGYCGRRVGWSAPTYTRDRRLESIAIPCLTMRISRHVVKTQIPGGPPINLLNQSSGEGPGHLDFLTRSPGDFRGSKFGEQNQGFWTSLQACVGANPRGEGGFKWASPLA